MKTSSLGYLATALTFAILLPSGAFAAPVVRSVGGDATALSITATRDAFRIDIGGGATVGANGSFGGVRREINWDAVPATQTAPNNLTANFFNSNSPRGAVFATAGTGFMVSGSTLDAGAGQPAAANFGNINATYSTTFGVFTAQRLFTSLGSNILDVNFFIPGTTTATTVSAFGAVFTDVDIAGSTTMQYFDQNNVTLGTFTTPIGSVGSQSLSFLGVSYNAGEKVSRVRITSGNAALAAGVNDGGATDLVVMDDFIYSEPVPEPSTLGLCAAGVVGFLSSRKRNRRGASDKSQD